MKQRNRAALPHGLRVIHLLKHTYRGNGHVHVAVDLACAQAASGKEVWLACTGGDYLDLLATNNVHLVMIPETGTIWSSVRAVLVLSRALVHIRPDVIHAHMMSSAVVGAVLARFFRIPLVTTVHNSFDRHSSLMKLGQLIVAVSEQEQRLLLDRGFPPSRLEVVWNGPLGSPRERLDAGEKIELHTPSIMTLSGLHGRKGVDCAIRAFGTVVATHPEWHLNIVGGGPDRAALQALIERHGLQASTHLLGPTRNPRDLLRKSSLFVSAALAEPFGLNLVEARAAGCAIAATRVGGIPEVLDEGRAGLLVAPGDDAALAVAMLQLIEDDTLRAQLSAAAQSGLDRFSSARMASSYDEVYQRVKANQTNRRAMELGS